MLARMRMIFLITCWTMMAAPAFAAPPSAESETTKEAAESSGAPAQQDIPGIADAIPGPVAALGKPAMMDFEGGIRMAVSTTSELAQQHVLQGLNHLHGGWEFEASRHFAAAMREDPECLLAHWGMIMALLQSSPESHGARVAATERLLGLLENGKGTELERGYAYGIIKYIENGPAGAAEAFRKVANRFPNELQASVFGALFSRGGFDAVGDPTPDQKTSETILLELIKKHPDSPVPLNALLVIRAEGPDLRPSLEMARALCKMQADYPPYWHLLGHYEWRCGNHREAAAAFSTASSMYEKWMKDNEATIADCPEWLKAESYRILSVASRGQFETAYADARRLAAKPLPADRPASPGARYMLWDCKTLPARILVHRGLRGNASEAARSLPKPGDLKNYRDHSLAYWWIDGMRFVLEAHQLVDAGKLTEAREVIAALTHHGESMAEIQSAAAKGGERSAWTRSFRALEVLASDLRGRVALAGPASTRDTAYNWFSSATDRQRPATMMMPPLVLTPMASRLGDYYLQKKQTEEAIEAYERALSAFPNDASSLAGLKRAYEAAGESEKAAEVSSRIDELTDGND